MEKKGTKLGLSETFNSFSELDTTLTTKTLRVERGDDHCQQQENVPPAHFQVAQTAPPTPRRGTHCSSREAGVSVDFQGLCSEREWNDRPVLGLLLVTVCVEVPLQGCL